jgi:peptidoglycan hydrolase-like protein with peptidoglycan-binding domain
MRVNSSMLISIYWALVVPVSSFLLFSLAFADALSVCPFVWERNLKVGSTGEDVLALQKLLNSESSTQIAKTGVGSPGMETKSFGPLTKAAVIKFQEKHASEILSPVGLAKGTGAVGVFTRAKLNALCTAPVRQKNLPSLDSEMAQVASAISAHADTLSVSDPGQPESSIAPANVGMTFLSFTLTAGNRDVVVRNIIIRRAGLGTDGALSSIGLYGEDGLQIGNVKSFNAKHEALLNEPFTVLANTSQKFDVAVNTAADMTNYDGQVPHLELVSIDASSPVSGILPIIGSPQTINASLVVGSATAIRSPYDPGSATTRYINDTNIRFSGIRMTADSKEDLTLSNIIWRQAGTAGPSDVLNVATVVNGQSYPATVRGRDYISFFEPGILIKKGESIDVHVQGDLGTTGSNRTVKFDIYDNTDDVALSGNTYELGVGVSPSGNTDVAGVESAFITSDGTADGDTGTPFYSGSTVTISGGAATSIGKN